MSHKPSDRIRAIRITDMILATPRVAEPDTPAIRRYKANHVRDGIDALEHHVCQYDEPGVCEDCTRKPKPKRGSARFVRIEKARRKRQAKLNGAREVVDDG